MSDCFKKDTLSQTFVDIICSEKRERELLDACDIYHYGFESIEQCMEFSFNFGEYVGRFRFGETVWEFTAPNSNTRLYFIGSYDEVKTKIYDIL